MAASFVFTTGVTFTGDDEVGKYRDVADGSCKSVNGSWSKDFGDWKVVSVLGSNFGGSVSLTCCSLASICDFFCDCLCEGSLLTGGTLAILLDEFVYVVSFFSSICAWPKSISKFCSS